MTAEYVIGLLGIFGSFCAILAFVWAIRHRQIQTEDKAMYEALADDEPDYSAPAVPPKPPLAGVRWTFTIALTLVFVLVGYLIVQTVRVAGHGPRPLNAAPR